MIEESQRLFECIETHDDEALPICFQDKRHAAIEGSTEEVNNSWRIRDRVMLRFNFYCFIVNSCLFVIYIDENC